MQAIKRRALPLGKSILNLGLLAGLACWALLGTGCQGRFPSERIPKMVWLVMPLEQPPAMGEATRAIRGWWFGARTIRQNPRAGEMLAEDLNRDLARLEFVNLYSQIDMRYYFAEKRRLLKKSYNELSNEEIEQLLGQVPVTEYARELGADKILTGRIIRNYMAENRTIHWWWSLAEVECNVIDVASGKTEWTRHYVLSEQLASQSSVLEDLSRRVVADLKKQYFRPLAGQ